MDEDFQRERDCGGFLRGLDGGDFLEGIFASEDDELRAEFAREVHARGAGDCHLRGAVDREIRREFADDAADADVLDDGGIDTGGDDSSEVVAGGVDLVGEHERVERHVAAHAAAVEKFHQRRQIGEGEILGAHPGIEALEAEIDRVGAILDGRVGALPVARGREQLRAPHRGSGGEGSGKGGSVGHGSKRLQAVVRCNCRRQPSDSTTGSTSAITVGLAGPATRNWRMR